MENPKSWAVQKIAPEFPLGSIIVHNGIKIVFQSEVNSYAPKSCSDISLLIIIVPIGTLCIGKCFVFLIAL